MNTTHMTSPIYIIDSMIIGDILTPENNNIFVYNISNKYTYQNDNINDITAGKILADRFILSIEGVVDNEIISVMINYEWYQKMVEYGFPAAPKDLEQQLNDGEPLLIFYSIKKTK